MRRLLPVGVILFVSTVTASCGGRSGGHATYTISGTITGASDVTLALAGMQSASTTSDSAGHFEFTALRSGAYTITPSSPGYGFTPASRQVTVRGADVPGQDFSGMTCSWVAMAPMPVPRAGLAVAATRGKLYIIGGVTDQLQDILRGGTDQVEEYDPFTDAWTLRAPMSVSRGKSAAAALNGRVYAMGGGTDQVEEYDPATDTWRARAPMPAGLVGLVALAAAVANGKIYVFGGNMVAEYDPVADTWSSKAPMPTTRYRAAAVEVSGKIYVMGGNAVLGPGPGPSSIATKSFDTVEEYDPATDTWATRTPMPIAREDVAAAVLDGKILVMGGGGHVMGEPGFLNRVDQYDPATDGWAPGRPMPTGRSEFAAVTLDDAVYAVGGSNWFDSLATLEACTRAEKRAPAFVEIRGSPFAITASPALSRDEDTLFAFGKVGVSVLDVAPGGALTVIGEYPTGSHPAGMALDPSGRRLYVETADGIAVHEVAPDRSLSQIGLAPYPAPALHANTNGIQYVVTAAGGGFLYVNEASVANSVSAYPVLPSGLLGVPATWPTGGHGIGYSGGPNLVSHAGRLFAGNEGSISVFEVEADGSLALVPGSPFTSALQWAQGLAGLAGPYTGPEMPTLAIDPSGSWLYAILDGHTGVRFAVHADGTLVPAGSFWDAPPPLDPFTDFPPVLTGLTVHPSGRWLTAAYGSAPIQVWDTSAFGAPVWTGYGAIGWNTAGTLAFGVVYGSEGLRGVEVYSFSE